MNVIALPHAGDEGQAGSAILRLAEAIDRLSDARTVEDVAAVVDSAARSISGADGVTFALREGDRCIYIDEEAISPLWKGLQLPMNACICGWTMLNGQTAVIPDVDLDPRIPPNAFRSTFVKSMVVTPVRPSDPVAAIGVYWAKAHVPSAEEEAGLTAVARAASAALEGLQRISSLETQLLRRDWVIRELSHHLKDSLAMVRAMAQQTQRTAPSAEAFEAALMGRLEALAGADELFGSEGAGVLLEDVLERSVLALEPSERPRVSVRGPQVRLSPQTAVSLQLAFHELASNAQRFGALSTDAGRVSVRWRIEQKAAGPRFHLTWREQGGPLVRAPQRRGFGLRMIEHGLPVSLGGKAELVFDPDGVRLSVTAPLSDAIAAA